MAYIIDLLLSKGADILYMKYVLNKQPEFLGELYSKTCATLIDNITLTHDIGDEKKIIKKFWGEDKEPGAAPIDSWARHRVLIDIQQAEVQKDEEVSQSTVMNRRGHGTRPNPKDDYSYCSFTEPEEVEKFLNAPFEESLKELPVDLR